MTSEGRERELAKSQSAHVSSLTRVDCDGKMHPSCINMMVRERQALVKKEEVR